MARTTLRFVKKPLRPEAQHRVIRAQLIQALQAVGKAHVAERREIVRGFKTEIEFDYQVRLTPKEVRVLVFVANSGDSLPDTKWTVGDLWRALDREGTGLYGPLHKKYPITPKNAKRLKFKWNGPGSYVPKTVRGGRNPGGGFVRGGKTVYRKKVMHPGFKARKFSERINRQLRPFFDKQVKRGYQRGFAEAERRNG